MIFNLSSKNCDKGALWKGRERGNDEKGKDRGNDKKLKERIGEMMRKERKGEMIRKERIVQGVLMFINVYNFRDSLFSIEFF